MDVRQLVYSRWVTMTVTGLLIVVLLAGFGTLPASADGSDVGTASLEDYEIETSLLANSIRSVDHGQMGDVSDPAQMDGNESWNRIVINASGGQEQSFYDFTVSGDINPEKVNTHDSVSYHRAEGYVGTEGKDVYRFTGTITEFDFEGPARVYLNGEEVGPDRLAQKTVANTESTRTSSSSRSDSEKWPNLLVINASGSQDRSFYSFDVSGVLNPMKTNAHETVSTRHAEGYVGTEGKDVYRFSGTITEFDFEGPARIYLNGEKVTPQELLYQSANPTTRTSVNTTTPEPVETSTSAGTPATPTNTETVSESHTEVQTNSSRTTTGRANRSENVSGSGPGFGALAAIFALLFSALVVRNRL